jgi:hypothetical protein
VGKQVDISQETIRLLVFLAPGFLAFRVYMIDADWSGVRQLDIIYGSLVFSALSYACFLLIAWGTGFSGMLSFIGITFGAAIILSLLWKRFGHPKFHVLLKKLGMTNEDNQGDVWQKIFNDPRIYVTQITAYLKNGEVIMCDGTASFDRPELRAKGIFPYYSHRDGQLCFVPNQRKRSAEADWKPVEDVEADANWGLRMVYVAPSELQRLELRITPTR